MSLAALQREFQALVVAEDDAPRSELYGGLAVYRNAYRSRLLECLQSSFERTSTWIGEDAFAAAACHHVIVHRPRNWTLDAVGEGFDETLAALLPGDPEVAELAWLERSLQDVFTAPDVAVVEPSAFAARTVGYAGVDWAALRLRLVPGIMTRVVTSDCVALWHAIGAGEKQRNWSLDGSRTALVWRQELLPHCRLLDVYEANALASLGRGESFGELCEFLVAELGNQGVAAAGAFLGRWLSDGLLQEVPHSGQSE